MKGWQNGKSCASGLLKKSHKVKPVVGEILVITFEKLLLLIMLLYPYFENVLNLGETHFWMTQIS